MKKSFAAGAILLTVVGLGGIAAALPAPPKPLPPEQQALVNLGYIKKADGLLQKTSKGCTVTANAAYLGYYIQAKGLRDFTEYPVPADRAVEGAHFAESICLNG